MKILGLACPQCDHYVSFIQLDSNGITTCKKCKASLIARGYHKRLGAANAIFFLLALPINALLFSGWFFWLMDFLSALFITSISLRGIELEVSSPT